MYSGGPWAGFILPEGEGGGDLARARQRADMGDYRGERTDD